MRKRYLARVPRELRIKAHGLDADVVSDDEQDVGQIGVWVLLALLLVVGSSTAAGREETGSVHEHLRRALRGRGAEGAAASGEREGRLVRVPIVGSVPIPDRLRTYSPEYEGNSRART